MWGVPFVSRDKTYGDLGDLRKISYETYNKNKVKKERLQKDFVAVGEMVPEIGTPGSDHVTFRE